MEGGAHAPRERAGDRDTAVRKGTSGFTGETKWCAQAPHGPDVTLGPESPGAEARASSQPAGLPWVAGVHRTERPGRPLQENFPATTLLCPASLSLAS